MVDPIQTIGCMSDRAACHSASQTALFPNSQVSAAHLESIPMRSTRREATARKKRINYIVFIDMIQFHFLSLIKSQIFLLFLSSTSRSSSLSLSPSSLTFPMFPYLPYLTHLLSPHCFCLSLCNSPFCREVARTAPTSVPSGTSSRTEYK